ncbi:unnamed protein product, partial [Discosporangium mesarthrocarpum]
LLDLGTDLDGGIRVMAQASLVLACSFFDGHRAGTEARKLPHYSLTDFHDGDTSMDPVTLEMTELPRSTKAKRLVLVDKASQKLERQRRRMKPEEQARKRAKQREKYLAKLVAEGKLDPKKPLPKPDPERWLPRSQRSYGKRGRKRNNFVGAQ